MTLSSSPASPAVVRRTGLSWAVVGVLALGGVIVPSLFTTRLRDAFVVPKLGAIWLLLVIGLLIVAVGPLSNALSGAGLRWLPAVDVAGIALLALDLLAAAHSIDRHQSLFGERFQYQGLLTTLLYAGSFLLARHGVFDLRRLRLLFAGITAGASLVAGYAILQRADLDPFWKGFLPEGRVFSTFGQPNSLAAYLVLAVAPACYLTVTTRGVGRVVSLIVALEVLLALLLTVSRGGLLGLVVMPILPVWCAPSKRRVAVAVAGLVVIAAGCAVFVAPARHALAGASTTFATRGGGEGRLSIDNHLDEWAVAARIARDHPLLGTGQETFPEVFPRYSHAALPVPRAAYFDAFRVESAHNVLLTMAANTGLLSVVAYIGLLSGFVLFVVRAAGAERVRDLRLGLVAIGAAVVGHLASDSFMTAEITSTWLLWLLVGAGVGVLSELGHPGDRSEGVAPGRCG